MKKKNGETTLADVVESIQKLDERVNRRLDGILKIIGGGHRDHERRISALEKAVAQLKKTG